MENEDREIVEAILLDDDYYDNPNDILARNTQKVENGRFIVLDLKGLELDEITENIEALDELQVLDIRNNQITELPIELSRMKNLKEIRITGNPIKSLPYGIDHIKFDVQLQTDSKKEIGKRIIIKPPKYQNNNCTWCGVKAGYRKERQKTEGTWGLTRHHSRMLVCLNCGYIHSFST